MTRLTQALGISFGALTGGAVALYVLEMYKIKAKEQRLAHLLDSAVEFQD
ncbi:hypothetical protein J3Q64DRAFT_1827856 [Phycomyces blakesleeanus]|uniref:Uncharacterized protein n=1 Tax=Phycomyces blakesleeanus TaxID=4837 RepID=A0ABR3BD51_PHYBL